MLTGRPWPGSPSCTGSAPRCSPPGSASSSPAMAARQASEDFAVRAFWYAWLRSILDHLSLTDLPVGSFAAEAHDKAVREFTRR